MRKLTKYQIKFKGLGHERSYFKIFVKYFSGNSAKYASRTNPGTVVHSFGEDKLLQTLAKANGPNDLLDLCITQVPNEDGDIYTKAM